MNPRVQPPLSFRIVRFLCAFAAVSLGLLRAADDGVVMAVRAADDARIAATLAADRAELESLYSDELHYGHSNGKADTKASQIAALTSRRIVYESFKYKERTFLPAAPGVVLMRGRVLVQASSNGQNAELDLTYLAVWREEKGKWRFLAWQSCKTLPSTGAAK